MRNLRELAEAQPETRHDLKRRLAQVAGTLGLAALLLFAPAGSLRWLYAWLYLAAYLLVILTDAFVLPLDVMAERGSRRKVVREAAPDAEEKMSYRIPTVDRQTRKGDGT